MNFVHNNIISQLHCLDYVGLFEDKCLGTLKHLQKTWSIFFTEIWNQLPR